MYAYVGIGMHQRKNNIPSDLPPCKYPILPRKPRRYYASFSFLPMKGEEDLALLENETLITSFDAGWIRCFCCLLFVVCCLVNLETNDVNVNNRKYFNNII